MKVSDKRRPVVQLVSETLGNGAVTSVLSCDFQWFLFGNQSGESEEVSQFDLSLK